jgi:hypothetical protein
MDKAKLIMYGKASSPLLGLTNNSNVKNTIITNKIGSSTK